jgi:hypothetical protein
MTHENSTLNEEMMRRMDLYWRTARIADDLREDTGERILEESTNGETSK